MKRRYTAQITVNGETKTRSTAANSPADASNKLALAAVTNNPGKDVRVGKVIAQNWIPEWIKGFFTTTITFKEI